jgi:hypothetical protein
LTTNLLVRPCLLFKPGLKLLGQEYAAESVQAVRSAMLLEKPIKSFGFGQIVFDTVERQPASLTSELPSGIAVEDRPVLRDQERLSKHEIPKLGE